MVTDCLYPGCHTIQGLHYWFPIKVTYASPNPGWSSYCPYRLLHMPIPGQPIPGQPIPGHHGQRCPMPHAGVLHVPCLMQGDSCRGVPCLMQGSPWWCVFGCVLCCVCVWVCVCAGDLPCEPLWFRFVSPPGLVGLWPSPSGRTPLTPLLESLLPLQECLSPTCPDFPARNTSTTKLQNYLLRM